MKQNYARGDLNEKSVDIAMIALNYYYSLIVSNFILYLCICRYTITASNSIESKSILFDNGTLTL